MAEEEAASPASEPSVTRSETLHRPPPFLEVACKSSGKVRRFAAGTKAGFALHIITKKLEYGSQPGSFIEAVKKGEEPVTFGPDATLVDYGSGWKLQTAGESLGVKNGGIRPATNEFGSDKTLKGSYLEVTTGQAVDAQYLGRIFLAFVFLFLLGAVFTVALENLPRLIAYISSNLM
uniref:Uncharacterized protein n=1 Tax=Kalanchoe fedtschenkoi TaxID=63787 RepID=A0A7N0V2C6_KALFE